MPQLRHRLADELHHRGSDGRVITLQWWESTVGEEDRRVVLVDGAVSSNKPAHTEQDRQAAALVRQTAHDQYDKEALTDEQARAVIKKRTGIEHYPWCPALEGDCPAPVPLGAVRCLDGHLITAADPDSMAGVPWVGARR